MNTKKGLELERGTVVNGNKVISMFHNTETGKLTVNFEDGDSLIVKQHESIAKVLNHKWSKGN
tara:strand:+ start:772 stop:960 length:189 start_codon:yes stop_codon:yes gene_type:complete